MSAPRRFNDDALEWAIAGARVASAMLAVLWVSGMFAAIALGSWRLEALSVVALALGIVAGWWGWYVMGNQEWRQKRATRPPEH